MSVTRHFTATGFVVYNDHLLLHWHPKVKAWLPPGGHIAENEDPVQAVLREIAEETGICVEVVPTSPWFGLDYPDQVYSPATIMVEDINDPTEGYHQHIDMIYFCRPVGLPDPSSQNWIWVGKSDLEKDKPIHMPDLPLIPPPPDVGLLAREAFKVVNALP